MTAFLNPYANPQGEGYHMIHIESRDVDCQINRPLADEAHTLLCFPQLQPQRL